MLLIRDFLHNNFLIISYKTKKFTPPNLKIKDLLTRGFLK